MAVGTAGVLALAAVEPSSGAAVAARALHQFLFGLALGVTFSGVFRATTRAAVVSTLALAAGFAVGAVVDVV